MSRAIRETLAKLIVVETSVNILSRIQETKDFVFFSSLKSGMAGNTSFFLVWSVALIVAALGYGIGFHLR